jgi:cell fate regulator YaaT (PSP1 superfamily)
MGRMSNDEQPLDVNNTNLVVGVRYDFADQTYFYKTSSKDIYKVGDHVIIENMRGLDLGVVCIKAFNHQFEEEVFAALTPIIRMATKEDLAKHEEHRLEAKMAATIFNEETAKLHLDMNLIATNYTLDHSKVNFTYVSEERVDFRELLKVLSYKLRVRIELRQVGTRDRAKIIGGIGICGLPLCCTLFMNDFDGISIGKAKNQMLSLNIPKISGHCGKLICCLRFEDDNYTIAREKFPQLNSYIKIQNEEGRVGSINIFLETITIFDLSDGPKIITLAEYEKLKAKAGGNA